MDEKINTTEPLLVSITTAAELLSCGRTMLYALIAKKEIRVIKLGRATRISMAELHNYVQRQSEPHHSDVAA